MPNRTLTLRELNRATLARQLLLEPASMSSPDAVKQVAGLQAQTTNAPYIGLWTRLRDFQREDLSQSMEQRQIVRATMMRSTLHLMTATDYLLLRPPLQPALTRALNAFFGQRAKGLDIDRLVLAARAFFEEQPRPFTELRAFLSQIEPERDPEALAYAVRTHLPLVQVYPGGRWGYGGSLAYAEAEAWLGHPLSDRDELRTLIFRYLAAFGPASVQDVQAWSGLVKLKEPLEQLKPNLCVFRDEQGRELLDLPEAPLPAGDMPAPVHFLPEYDNLILSHADRTRVVADEYRSSIFLSAGRVRSTFLIDGWVQGAWKIERKQNDATLIIEPFTALSPGDRLALSEEGDRLVRFVEDRAVSFDVRFAERN